MRSKCRGCHLDASGLRQVCGQEILTLSKSLRRISMLREAKRIDTLVHDSGRIQSHAIELLPELQDSVESGWLLRLSRNHTLLVEACHMSL